MPDDERVEFVELTVAAIEATNVARAAARRAASKQLFGHTGASMPTLPQDMSRAEIVEFVLMLAGPRSA